MPTAGLERLSRLDGGLTASDGWTGRGDGEIMGIGFVRYITYIYPYIVHQYGIFIGYIVHV